jgi:hypothetical protein
LFTKHRIPLLKTPGGGSGYRGTADSVRPRPVLQGFRAKKFATITYRGKLPLLSRTTKGLKSQDPPTHLLGILLKYVCTLYNVHTCTFLYIQLVTIVLVAYRPYNARTCLFMLINKQNRAMRTPPPPPSQLRYSVQCLNNCLLAGLMENLRKILVWGKIREPLCKL